MPVLRVENVCKNFGGVVAASDISFSVDEGEIVGLIGPNGAGKTTLLNLVSGIYDCDSGAVYFEEKDITKVPSYKRARMGISRTFQTPHFLKRSSVRDNMMVGMDLAKQIGHIKSFFRADDESFEEEFAALQDIAGFEVDWSMDISAIPYGQQKRLEIMRALLTHPKVILIDEPAAGLNENEIDCAIGLIRYATEQGIGIVLIEHKMDMVMKVSDKIVVLNFGRIIGYGTPHEVSGNQEVIEAYLGRDEDADNS